MIVEYKGVKYKKVLMDTAQGYCEQCTAYADTDLCKSLSINFKCSKPNAIFTRESGMKKIMVVVEDYDSLCTTGTLSYRTIDIELTPEQERQTELKDSEVIVRMNLIRK